MYVDRKPDSSVMKQALEGYMGGVVSREDFLHFLKWEMAIAEDWSALSFIADVKDLDPNGDLALSVRRTYEYVRLWEFPEEPGLSNGVREAIECTFPELIHSVTFAILQLGQTRNMLAGLNIRLDLRDTDAAFATAVNLLSEELEILESTCESIGNLDCISREFPTEDEQGSPSWTAHDGAPLSPKELLELSRLARWDPPFKRATYAEGISAHSTPPQLVTARINAEEQRRIWEAAAARRCPHCNSAAGVSCRTPDGKPRIMHRRRYTVPA